MNILSENLVNYYWAGFITADGTFCKSKQRLRLHISCQDKDHLMKWANLTNRPIRQFDLTNSCYVDLLGDQVTKFCKKFDIRERKTYNPPKIKLVEDQFLSWFIGFVDGDGHIKYQRDRSDILLEIHIHANWLIYMQYINDTLYNMFQYTKYKGPHILKSGFLRYNIGCQRTIRDLKKFAINYTLPILKRKWDKVNINYIHKWDKAAKIREQILKMKSKGLTFQQIGNELDINPSTAAWHYRRAKQLRD